MSARRGNYLRLAAALACLGMAALSFYTGRGTPHWGFIACAAFIVSTALNLDEAAS